FRYSSQYFCYAKAAFGGRPSWRYISKEPYRTFGYAKNLFPSLAKKILRFSATVLRAYEYKITILIFIGKDIMIKSCNYKVTYSKRRTIAVSVNSEAEVIVKAPIGTSKNFISSFVEKHSKWIEKQLAKAEARLLLPSFKDFNAAEIKALKHDAKQVTSEYSAHWADIMNVKPAGIKITSAKSRWGSCSFKNVICFPYRIILLPPELIECIVVHELAHIKIKNHSQEFYKYIESVMPDYKERAKRLKDFSL
ncbi:MAG: M48 family metallopeptidase, partial [Defluviitaleaceae bacterium]|nr:M48 family metallopeptidase [Defluviitaleaceae bacterium]